MLAASRLRGRVAEEAARLIQEQGIDFRQAKHKAAARLGVSQQRALPSNQEIEQRLIDRQRLFDPEQHRLELNRLRELALTLMADLAPFSPRAVGSVVNGALSPATAIQLHLFADGVEAVCSYLDDKSVCWRSCTVKLLQRRGERESLPALRIDIEDRVAELVIFGPDGERQAPLSPVDGRPMQRLSPKRLAALVVPIDEPCGSSFSRD